MTVKSGLQQQAFSTQERIVKKYVYVLVKGVVEEKISFYRFSQNEIWYYLLIISSLVIYL